VVERPHVEHGGRGVSFVARDPGGQVAAVEVAVDGRGWQPVLPLDGVADSVEERYEVAIEPPQDDEITVRSLRVRVVDAAGNLGGDLWVLGDGER
jgi:FtsP/CotA-like multicopper oxidase with cupredoxin domain